MQQINKYSTNLLLGISKFIFGKKEINKKIYLNEDTKILIVHFGSVQQALNITPLIKTLKAFFKNSIHVLTNENGEIIFSKNGDIRNVFQFPSNIKSCFHLIRRLRSRRYDSVLLAEESPAHFTFLMLSLIKSKFKVGFKNKHEKLLTHRVPPADYSRLHVVDRILTLTEAFEIDYDKGDLNIIFEPSNKTKMAVETFRITHDLTLKATVVLNISTELDIGFWGVESYKRLIKYLKNYDIHIIIASSIEDMEKAEEIADGKYLVYYHTDIESYAQFLRSSTFIFSPDSFTVQLAAAYKIPIFCLFVQHKTTEMINVPYNSDFDFSVTEDSSLEKLSYGKVLNSFVPYFEYVYGRYSNNDES